MSKSIKNLFLVFIIGIIVFVVANALYDGFNFSSTNEFFFELGMYQLYSFVLGYSNMVYFNYLASRTWQSNSRVKRFIIGIGGATIITLFGLFILRVIQSVGFFGKDFKTFLAQETWQNYGFGLWITLTIVIIFHFIYYYNEYQQKRIKEQKVIAGTASAKFDALKNQLDPHFLFNSLNVLTSLIDENPESAQKFTTALSKVYRYVLEQKNKDLVTVNEELEFAKTYMSLLKMRFEDSIIFEIPEQASDPESKVVPLSLQLLLENAVKHNMVTSTKPLHIKIYETNNLLVVENNLQPKQIVKKSSGVGLDNIKQRYDLLTDRKVNINQKANSFAVAIPMLSKQITVMRTRTKEQFDDSYVRARKHVEEVKEFYYSLISYIIVIPFLAFINYWTFWGYQWFWWPMLGWGIGLLIHAYKVFVNDGIFGRNWERRKIEEFMREDEEKNRWN
ncbi:MAG: 2TM domain-containing protein [Flavobacteriaceae bacterium]|nr:2TM domain-containing protein [Flavobacteriaceae bacterium]